jgi:hypothetical protein
VEIMGVVDVNNDRELFLQLFSIDFIIK